MTLLSAASAKAASTGAQPGATDEVERADDPATAGEQVFELPAAAAAAGMVRREPVAISGIVGALASKALLMTSELVAVHVAQVEPTPAATPRSRLGSRPSACASRSACGRRTSTPDALLHAHDAPSLGGYGLQIVERMAEARGVACARDTIWFELARRS